MNEGEIYERLNVSSIGITLNELLEYYRIPGLQ